MLECNCREWKKKDKWDCAKKQVSLANHPSVYRRNSNYERLHVIAEERVFPAWKKVCHLFTAKKHQQWHTLFPRKTVCVV
jgi:hypothetical protein